MKGSRNLCGNQGIRMVQGGRLGDCLASRCQLTCTSWYQESKLIRLKAFILFGKLAKVVGISKKHFFKGEVKRGWVSLMLHCQDPCPSVAQVTHTIVCVLRSGAAAPKGTGALVLLAQ